MIFLLVIFGCAKEVAPHLRVDTRAPVEDSNIDPAQQLEALIRRDPLVRRPDPRTAGAWSEIADGAAVESWAAVARQPHATPSDWTETERRWPGTLAVPFSRGARLAAIEVSMAGELDIDVQRSIAGWLGATRVEANPSTLNPSEPMDWVPGGTPKQKRESALRMAERSVLLGWLDGPNMDLITPALALSSDNYSRLAGTPAGALLRARAAMEQDPEAGARGRQALQRATLLALAEAAADTDMEQASFRQRMANERKTVGEQREPIAAYLERARHGLTANASNPASTGFALIAIAGERIVGSCPDGACMGLDRTASLNAASRWSDETRRLMYAWHVIALKRAVDTLEVSHKTAGFGRSIPMIAEALSGTSGSPIELSLLRYRIKEPTALIQLTQMAGGPPTAAIEETITAVRQLLIDACNAALRERVNVDQATLIHKIGTRAAQPVASPH